MSEDKPSQAEGEDEDFGGHEVLESEGKPSQAEGDDDEPGEASDSGPSAGA